MAQEFTEQQIPLWNGCKHSRPSNFLNYYSIRAKSRFRRTKESIKKSLAAEEIVDGSKENFPGSSLFPPWYLKYDALYPLIRGELATGLLPMVVPRCHGYLHASNKRWLRGSSTLAQGKKRKRVAKFSFPLAALLRDPLLLSPFAPFSSSFFPCAFVMAPRCIGIHIYIYMYIMHVYIHVLDCEYRIKCFRRNSEREGDETFLPRRKKSEVSWLWFK